MIIASHQKINKLGTVVVYLLEGLTRSASFSVVTISRLIRPSHSIQEQYSVTGYELRLGLPFIVCMEDRVTTLYY